MVMVMVTPYGIIYYGYDWLLMSYDSSLASIDDYDLVILVLIMFIDGSAGSSTLF